MRRWLLSFALLLAAPVVHGALQVFACEPEWAALTREIAGDRAEVDSATSAREDPHRVQARPALIAQLRRADALVCTGADLEVGWLPLLLRQARNPGVQPGQPGHVLAAEAVTLLEAPTSVDRAEGDVHPQGNPHIQVDPRRVAAVARLLADRLAQIDPAGADTYRARAADFERRWAAALKGWERRAAELRGRRVVVHHAEWVYLFDWLGIQTAGALEPKPGLPPAAGHLAALKAELAARPADAIVRSPLTDPRPAQWLADETGLPQIELPHTVGATPDAGDLFALFDAIVSRLAGGLR
ncbi:MAG: zinc ABC transporter substrate-binding protein [Gammaproteobacteria bacterium]|nr:zinc ABC transporter substrate-binding protein [Gammaproteobacteria bacterium]